MNEGVATEGQNAELAEESPLDGDNLWMCLTRREQEVAVKLAQGRTNREIAKALRISVKTVDTHRGHILKKIGAANNAMLVHFAIARGWAKLQTNCSSYGHSQLVAHPVAPLIQTEN